MNKEKTYITLGQFLKMQDYVSSGGEAKHRINEFDILVNDEPEYRRGRKLYQGDRVVIDGQTYTISE